jgi:uncharacterized membrane protein YdjX (TVP38/TMEM64 family)
LLRAVAPLVLIAAVIGAAWASGLTDFLSLDALRNNRERLAAYTLDHPLMSLGAYVGIYIVVVVFSLPGALIMTLAGGMLFGAWLGAAAAVTSAATGATVIFLVGRSTFGAALRQRAGAVVGRLIDGFEKNAASYLLTLRLIPGVPFFAINLAAGLVRMRILTYVLITVIGIAPGSIIYASIGSSLVTIFARGEEPDLSIIFEPHVLGPLLALAALSLLPVAIQAWRRRRGRAETPA